MANLLPWQLFNDQGEPIAGKGAEPDDIFNDTLLHAAAHVWVWREGATGVEILLQKRSSQMKTYPNLLDISAAGHVDVNEQPLQTAVREVREEIGLEVQSADLHSFGILRVFMDISSGYNKGKIENEFRFMYLLQRVEEQNLTFADGEVHSVIWKPLAEMQTDLAGPNKTLYVPHPSTYFAVLFDALADCQKASAHAARQPAASR